MSINRVAISGNLTRDPELRSTANGTEVLTFGVAVNERVKDQQSGEWKDRPNFVDCVVFGNRAQGLSKYLAKGSKVAIDGRLRYSSWETDDGKKRSKLEVIAENVDFMSSRQQGGQPQQQTAAQQGQQPMPVAAVPPAAPQQQDVYQEDIPF